MDAVEGGGGAHGTLFIGQGSELRSLGRQDDSGRWPASVVIVLGRGGVGVALIQWGKGRWPGGALIRLLKRGR
jgi:hypothetical protein